MGFLFQEHINQRPSDTILNIFRLGIINSFEVEYEMYQDELGVLNVEESKSEFNKLKRKNSELETKYITNLFNEIGYSSKTLELKKEYVDWAGWHTYHYTMEDLWAFLITLPHDVFYGTMVYISQTSSTNNLLNKLQKVIKDELLRNRITVREYRKSVFIAMSFAEEMKEARERIMRAIEDKGYRAVIIDEKEHNEQIVPQIFEEISKAEFVVSDLTGHRNGVYYEAGFAKGLGKEVVFTCKKDDFEKSHFDVKQINTIMWKTVWELEEKLHKRIEAMMTSHLEEQHVPW